MLDTSNNSQGSMFSAEVSPVRICLWPASARAWLESGQGYGSSFYELLKSISRDSLSSRMSPAFYPAMKDETLPSSFEGWSNSIIASRAGCLTLNTTYDGVAQRRRRVFIVGSLGNGSCAEILFERESVSWNPPTRGEAGAGVTPILEAGTRTNGDGYRDGDGIGVEGDPMYSLQAGKQHAVAATLDQRGRGPTDSVMMNLQLGTYQNTGHGWWNESSCAQSIRTPEGGGSMEANVVAHALRSEGADASEDGTGRGTPIISVDLQNTRLGGDVSGALDTTRPSRGGGQAVIAFSSKDHGADAGEISPTLRSQNFKDSHINGGGQVAIAFHENKSGQLSEAETLGLRSGASHSYQGVGGPFGVRRLTPRECERLQGFPDDWTRYDAQGKEISDSARYRMLGNAVCVNVAEWIGRRIAERR